MKKIAPIVALALLAAGFTSCKKDYTCTCTTTANGVSTTTSGKTGKMKKADAKAACEKANTSYSLGGVSYSISCKI